jgi:hypothetical protein
MSLYVLIIIDKKASGRFDDALSGSGVAPPKKALWNLYW